MKLQQKSVSAFFSLLSTILICFIYLGIISSTASAATSKFNFSTNVKENQSRNVIQAIQTALINAGYDPGLADGYSGPRTSAALKSFQRDHKMKITGDISQSALKAIRNSLASDN